MAETDGELLAGVSSNVGTPVTTGNGGFVGARVGRKDICSVPDTVGLWVESAIVGIGVGCFVGVEDGAFVMNNGDCVGIDDGDWGLAEGESVGFMTGD